MLFALLVNLLNRLKFAADMAVRGSEFSMQITEELAAVKQASPKKAVN